MPREPSTHPTELALGVEPQCEVEQESNGPSSDPMPTKLRALPPPLASFEPTTLELPAEPLSNLKSKYGKKGGPIGDASPTKLVT